MKMSSRQRLIRFVTDAAILGGDISPGNKAVANAVDWLETVSRAVEKLEPTDEQCEYLLRIVSACYLIGSEAQRIADGGTNQ